MPITIADFLDELNELADASFDDERSAYEDALDAKDVVIADKDATIAARDATIVTRDGTIVTLEAQISALEAQLGSGGTAFMEDTFTDADGTLLTGHAGELGAAWTLQNGYTPSTGATINTNRIYTPAANACYQASATPASADYSVEAEFECLSVLSGTNVGVAGRMQAGANTMYLARWLEALTTWQLLKLVNGTATPLGGNLTEAWTSGTRTVRLQVIGNQVTLITNAGRIGPITDGSITSAGKAGFRSVGAQTATTGVVIKSIKAVA
jgi:hypothetical protein